jgi:subtilisin family serine protease
MGSGKKSKSLVTGSKKKVKANEIKGMAAGVLAAEGRRATVEPESREEARVSKIPIAGPIPTPFSDTEMKFSSRSGANLSKGDLFALGTQGRERKTVDSSKLRPGVFAVNPDMDPRLQAAVACRRLGYERKVAASAAADEIPVIAKVDDLEKWEQLSEVRIGESIKLKEPNQYIVTARIPVQRIEAVRSKGFVLSLKATQPVHTALSSTVTETLCQADRFPSGIKAQGGKGVVIGIVDFGCDFAHRNFLDSKGKTRIESIWHQAASGGSNASSGYGRVYRADEINRALKKSDPYAALGYGPDRDSNGTHGTHVMDIAAGNGGGSGVGGCAPEATIIFVDLSANDVNWFGADVVHSNFGDSVRLLEAVKFIFNEAGDRPCVVNLSLGTNGGPHDGSTLVEQGLDALVTEKHSRSIVVAASNSYDDRIHTSGIVPTQNALDVAWLQSSTNQPGEMEVWYPKGHKLAVQLITPDNTPLEIVEPGANKTIQDGNTVVIFIANRQSDPARGDNNIGIYFADVFPAGQWTVRLINRTQVEAPFHAWIERLDDAQSSFPHTVDLQYSLGSISCSKNTIVVGSYDGHKTSTPISYFSSSGPTRDQREKPEISAPGHAVVAARSRSSKGTVLKSGTSMAAPAVAGIIALIYAQASHKGKQLSADQVRKVLINSARQKPPATAPGTWDPRYGFGRINAKEALQAI